MGFREGDLGLAERGEGAWQVGVFDIVVLFRVERWMVGCIREGSPLARMGDAVLTDQVGAIGQASGDVVREIGIDSGEYGDLVRHAAYCAEQVDGAFEAAGEDACTILRISEWVWVTRL